MLKGGRKAGAFRNCQVAAPLKPGLRPPCPRIRNAFRNCQVAAPLKRMRGVGMRGVGMRLPQLSSCGPIEAGRPSRRSVRAPSLPQLSSCGPIEAGQFPVCGPDIPRLPQLSSCGPIEALFRLCGARRPGAFRNCQVAAPLKHCVQSITDWKDGILPQLSSCGPIEADRGACRPAPRQPLPQLSSCGPIEAKSFQRLSMTTRGPSATVKLRPH